MMEKKYPWSQRGSVLILMAFFVPMIMAVTGMVVDFGNVYWHKSVLQNCADASAFGGAKVGAGKQFNHDAADKKVEELHEKNKRYASEIEKYKGHNGRYCDSKSNSKVHYYVVTMTENVPMFFLRYFGYKEMAIEATCIVNIEGKDTKTSFFNNLFIFQKNFEAVNSVEHPQKLTDGSRDTDSKGMVNTIYDGRIVYTKENGVDITYSKQNPTLDRFFNSEGQKYNNTHNIGELLTDDEAKKAKFNSDGSIKSGYWSKAEYYKYDYKPFIEYMDEKTKDIAKVNSDQNLSTSSSWFNKDVIRISNELGRVPNLTFNIDKSLGSSDKPIYVFVEAGIGNITINVSVDPGRPLIICVDGSDSQKTTVNLEMDNHTFRGVIYAPYSPDYRGVKTNAANGTFIGTIVGKSISLSGNASRYIYKDFIGKSGSEETIDTDSVFSISSPEDVKWD